MSLRVLLAAAWTLSAAGAAVLLVSADAGIVLVGATVVALAVEALLLAGAWRLARRSFGQLASAARATAHGEPPDHASALAHEAREAASALTLMAETVGARLRESDQQRSDLVAALDSSLDAVIAVDAGGRIAFANAGAEHLFARARAEMIGSPFAFVMPNEQVVEAIRASREEGRQETHIIELPNRQFLSTMTTPIVGGGAWTALVVVHDLSEARRVEQMRRDFVANVSHELRTPLAALKSVIETLDSGALEDPEVARDFLGRADAEIERLVQMVEELLELSRIESGDVALAREEVDLNVVASGAVERLRRQAERQGLALELRIPDVPTKITGDAVTLERAVVNLVHNAVKFTPSGGHVTVSVSRDDDDNAAVIQVQDTGVGIDAEDLPRVFERFYKTDRSRRAGGTGLGLTIVKHTVEAHGGSVWARSEPEKGSTFGFSLPLAKVSGG